MLQHRLGVHTTFNKDSTSNSSKNFHANYTKVAKTISSYVVIGHLTNTCSYCKSEGKKKQKTVTFICARVSNVKFHIQCGILECLNLLRGLLWRWLLIIPVSRICCISVHGRILRRPSITIWIISLGGISIIASIPLVLVLLRLLENSLKKLSFVYFTLFLQWWVH